MIVHRHLFGRHKFRHTELMLGLRLYVQGLLTHRHGQMERTGNGFVRKLSIKLYARYVDIVVDSVREGISPARITGVLSCVNGARLTRSTCTVAS